MISSFFFSLFRNADDLNRYDRDDASRIHRAVSVESSVVEEDSSDSDLD